jgi:hypothetical protein
MTFDYVAECLKTMPEDTQFFGEKVARKELMRALAEAVHALDRLDKIKKTLFYGRDNNLDPREGEADCDKVVFDTANAFREPRGNIVRLIHAGIGMATEGGEILEALIDLLRGEVYDPINWREEIGDFKWYAAIAAPVLGFAWGDDERLNIAKLRERFPDKFKAEDANNRNLNAERAVLEGLEIIGDGTGEALPPFVGNSE